ncbi:unnamed protein product [Rotaria magnacalcarata]|uniref:Uncharacterized protein n=8 Tax=Rotaria magnacalcarata TaxID=392030 RepID=A0A816A5N7_9BILA|nr:unnamed protein product [Rotaria magnacalcarata]
MHLKFVSKHRRIVLLLLLIVITASTLKVVRLKNTFSNVLQRYENFTKKYVWSDSHFLPRRVRIAIIGSSGYIGSRLFDHLRKENSWNVIGFDRIFPGQASYEISTHILQSFEVVIYLGGMAGRAICQDHPAEVDRENIEDIYNLAKRMLPHQLLIFASTSAVGEGSGSIPITEDHPIQSELLDLYSKSLFHREKTLRQMALDTLTTPQMIGLRFGTVVGLSASQRIDLSPMALVCKAFLSGKVHVTHPESNRAFLCMEDLVRAIHTVIMRRKQAKKFDIFHLQSFSASISKLANTIASLTGAHIKTSDHPVNEDSHGFSLNNNKFCNTFNFYFQGSLYQTISRLIEDVPRLCLGRQSRLDNDSISCVVCGSRIMHTVLNLHNQPLANDFKTDIEKSEKSKRFPLRLVRCPICHHTQISYVVDRKYLFSHYLYQSSTSKTLNTYFSWLAEKAISESEIRNGTVLEIACNDGSQLNEFLKRGWRTVGVDPAKNLADIARMSGHTIYTGFWGIDTFPRLSALESVDVIIAQNVLAHVDNPIQFLQACASMMSVRTKLYIQTSQCEMYETGQFDTVYHEHISFFTAHSFKKLADIVGLAIVRFEITSIHGHSCLVTFQRVDSSNTTFLTRFKTELTPSLSIALQKERTLGMTDPWFYIKYEAQAKGMREWISHQLASIQAQHHTIIAYGAAAKGMVLLHFLLEISNRSWNISFVIDDAPLKQNTFCPGTSIPVRPTSEFNKHTSAEPLTIIVFAWNFRDEILAKIRSNTIEKGIKNVFVILPFPYQQLLKIDRNNNTILAENSNKPLSWPFIFPNIRKPVLLISHFFNEEFLLPYWIRHHASMFDMAILIDYNSTDQSLEIIRREAPTSWKVVSSRNKYFNGQLIDDEVIEYEKMHSNAWKIVLNTPEFLIHSNLRQMLADIESNDSVKTFRFRSLIMSGNDSVPLKQFTSLVKQRSQYTYRPTYADEKFGITSYSRFIHCNPFAKYDTGRHTIRDTVWKWAPIGFIAKYQYTPWPEIIKRKLQIRTRIPLTEFLAGGGIQHDVTLEKLKTIKNNINLLPQHDLRDVTAVSEEIAMAHRLWKEIIDQ